MTRDMPIGVFDSGMGGFGVTSRIMRLMPAESILYLADTAHLPFGPRPADAVGEYVREAEAFFAAEGAKAMVIACNTASVVVDRLRGLVPVVEMVVPACRETLALHPRQVGILGTKGTIESGAYERELHRRNPIVGVVSQACEDALRLAEQGGGDDAGLLERLLGSCVEPVIATGCDVVILACTDFTCVRPTLDMINAGRTRFVDPAEAAARTLRNLLAEEGLLRLTGSPSHRFCVTSEPNPAFADFGRRVFGLPIEGVERVDSDR